MTKTTTAFNIMIKTPYQPKLPAYIAISTYASQFYLHKYYFLEIYTLKRLFF